MITKIIEEELPEITPVREEVPFYEQEQFDWRYLKGRPAMLLYPVLAGSVASSATNYGVFFTAPFNCEVLSVREAHEVASDDANPVTVDLEKLTGTQALDAGVSVLSSAISLRGAANTVVVPALTATRANRFLAVNNRLALKDSGVLNLVSGLSITIEIAPPFSFMERK